ncbi:amyloid-beta A4 precursor protein-binding family A member 3 isoform X2 [Eublepharis macularius]|uniref:Amyloid-beta A4 precursor protein-binding family A member 3 n=1 Tax=Eublepharis macularius TaxID=481883 RepID=A0AA97JG27_EUBMA|nr:amyloid-beta A4 precursor protein-binding family A member 3 isoform X2 [Eublepharis macularius]
MDIQTEAVSMPEGPAEPIEAPPMDLEENITGVEGAPPHDLREDDRAILPQPGSLQFVLLSSNMESRPRDAGLADTRKDPDNPEGSIWFPDPPSSNPQGATEDGVRNVVGEGAADTVALEGSTSWTRNTGKDSEAGSRPQAPPNADQLMDLEEGGEEDCPEANQIQGLLAQIQRLGPNFHDSSPNSEDSEEGQAFEEERGPLLNPVVETECRGLVGECAPCPLHLAMKHSLGAASHRILQSAREWRGQGSHGLLSVEADGEDLLSLLRYEGGVPAEQNDQMPLAHSNVVAGTSCQAAQETPAWPDGPLDATFHNSDQLRRKAPRRWLVSGVTGQEDPNAVDSSAGASKQESSPEPEWRAVAEGFSHGGEPFPPVDVAKADLSSFPAYKEVPGPCEPEDLLDGVIFGAKYLGSTQLISERTPPTSIRMAQAQEAVDRIKAPEGESQPMTEVDLFVSTQRIKVLTADSQEAMMDHPLHTISFIADIGNIVVLMARRKLPRQSDASTKKQLYKMICHVFHSADAQLIAQAIGQAFNVAYQHFLCASGIDPNQLGPRQDDDNDNALAKGEDLYNGDLAHFSKQENCKEVFIHKQKGEILGIVIVESGWGSILPTVVIANLMHGGSAETSGSLSIGDRIMSINGTSLVGLPLGTCQNIIRDLKNQTEVTLKVVHCPPVTTAIVRRPDTKYPLGFCVENGIICSLMRGGIAERGGIRVGHRIIEINGQSVVAMAHEKIIQILTQAVSEVHIKTMPASTYRLLTGQEQPVFL